MKFHAHFFFGVFLIILFSFCGNKGFTAPAPSGDTIVTPVTLLHDLKNGTKTKAQLKTALLGYMRKEACKTKDNVTRYTPEARRNKNIVNYVGFEKEWAVINKRSLSVLRETIPKLQSKDSSIRLEGLDDLTNLMLAFEVTTTPEKKQNRALRLLIGYFYFFPSLYFKEIKAKSLLSEKMVDLGVFNAIDFFEMGKDFYPLGIETYKHLLKAPGATTAGQSQYVYWISWGYLQLKKYDECIAWAKKMPPCIGMTDAPARLQKWAKQGKAKQRKKK